MSIFNSYSDVTEENVMRMTRDELIEVVLRMLNTKVVKAEDWTGDVILTDDLADSFRGRN